jgi:hypothetical protein
MDQLAAKVYFYYGRLHELVGGTDSLASIRPCVPVTLEVCSSITELCLQAIAGRTTIVRPETR